MSWPDNHVWDACRDTWEDGSNSDCIHRCNDNGFCNLGYTFQEGPFIRSNLCQTICLANDQETEAERINREQKA